MRMLALLPLAILAACENATVTPTATQTGTTANASADDGLTIDVSNDGKSASVQVGGAAGEATERSAIDLSPIAAPLPGASAAATTNTVEDGARKTRTTYTTAQSPADVAAVFDARIRAAGASPLVSATAGDRIGRVIVSNGGNTTLAIGIEPEDGATKVVVETALKG